MNIADLEHLSKAKDRIAAGDEVSLGAAFDLLHMVSQSPRQLTTLERKAVREARDLVGLNENIPNRLGLSLVRIIDAAMARAS